MKFPDDEIVITEIAGSRAVAFANTDKKILALNALGFLEEGDHLVRKIISEVDRINLLKDLIQLSALFSSGRDWSPAELVDFYRERGDIGQSYRVISWRGPGAFYIRIE